MENPFEEEKQGTCRPTFLTVLCILTFIAAGFSILSDLIVWCLPASFVDTLQVQWAGMVGEDKAEEMAKSFVDSKKVVPFDLLFSLVNLAGAILMFQLKRIGFYLYVPAQVLLVVLPGLLTGQWAIMGSAFWAVLFVALYAVNVKHLK